MPFRISLALTMAALTAAVVAQQPQPPQQPVFRSGVQIVEVDARVFDRDGRFVTGLTIGDFEILEDGVPQALVALALVGTPSSTGSPGSERSLGSEPREPMEPVERGTAFNSHARRLIFSR